MDATREALEAAAKSLEWISNRRQIGSEAFYDVLVEIRGYANSRAMAARAVLASQEPGGARSAPLVRSKEWWLRQADSEGPEDFDCTAGVPGPTTAERAAHWQQGAAAAYREQGMEHAASWDRARRLFSGMATAVPAPSSSPGEPRGAPLCCPPEPTERSECPHDRTEAGWCSVCGEDVSGSPSPGEAPRTLPDTQFVAEIPQGASVATVPGVGIVVAHPDHPATLNGKPLAPAPSEESDLEALQKLCDEATPGPWRLHENRRTLLTSQSHPLAELSEPGHRLVETRRGGIRVGKDGEFIAAARTALPALIAELRALRRAGGRT